MISNAPQVSSDPQAELKTPAMATPIAPTRTSKSEKTLKQPWRWRGGVFAGAYSAVGSYHPNNEDAYSHYPTPLNPKFCGLADGVGGGSHGDLASAAVLEHCKKLPQSALHDSEGLSQWVIAADEAIRVRVTSRDGKPAAATLVAAWFVKKHVVRISHVGDCRAYHLKPSQSGQWLRAITQDQTYTNLGLRPPEGGNGDDPARMLGVGAAGAPPVTEQTLAENESLFLCTDGLHKFLQQEHIAQIVGNGMKLGLNPVAICKELVEAAQANGGYDDTTAMLMTRRSWLGIRQLWRAAFLTCILIISSLQFSVCYKYINPIFSSKYCLCS